MDFGCGFDTPAPCHTARAADRSAHSAGPGERKGKGEDRGGMRDEEFVLQQRDVFIRIRA